MRSKTSAFQKNGYGPKQTVILAIAILKKAKEIVTRGWSQTHSATDSNGRPCETVEEMQKYAVNYCAGSAIDAAAEELHVGFETPNQLAYRTLADVAMSRGHKPNPADHPDDVAVNVLVEFNDEAPNKAAILSAFDEASRNLNARL